MFSLLHEYLVNHRSLEIPGTGRLELTRQPASYDVANQVVQPPVSSINLVHGEGIAGSNLLSFLGNKLGIPSHSAGDLYQSFSQKLKDELQEKGHIHFHHLGMIRKDDSGSLVFVPDERMGIHFTPVPAVRVIRQGSSHNMVVGSRETTSSQMQEFLSEQATYKPANRWWIPALVIGVLALTFIFLRRFHYI